MRVRTAKLFLIMLFTFVMAAQLSAQVSGAISGTVTNAVGKAVPNAKVTLRNLSTGQTSAANTGPNGHYEIPNLVQGDYEISVSAAGAGAKTARLEVTGTATQTFDVALGANEGQTPNEKPPAAPASSLPNAPSSTKTEPSLQELGFPPAETQGSAKEQALLNKRSHMLQIHQKLGLITTVPLVATVIAGSFAGGRNPSSTTRDVHAALGSATAGLYFATAYFAIRAPKVPGSETRGPIRLHKALAWIHGPGMILTPILGAIAFQQKSNGERVHGIASAHAPVAYITAIAYGISILPVTIKF